MGTKRVIDTEVWTDEKFEEFSTDEKLFWLYLLTNPFSRQLGIYHITKKQMAFQLGFDIQTVDHLIDKFQNEYKMIRYIDNEIAILNFLKRQILKGGKPVEDCLKADIKSVKHKELIDEVFEYLKDCDDIKDSVKKVIHYYLNDNDNDNDNERFVDVSSTYRDRIPTYDPSNNRKMSQEEQDELMKLMGRA